eukprot:CAMPEP_0202686688 /NCGR_PEP_ID=MMETSP1385-20130828/2445_1 /ASSEMBLY_ACC=CAM_ASM_000861 /TAXON_ID=933848 /ORGANISM="Elphidium margaritaceum" /LENGTH=422 /DNA_ID=CAMNT_0049341317 /DNA_START=12 /DNA_END=1280 /DNA_ORIENTATION=+
MGGCVTTDRAHYVDLEKSQTVSESETSSSSTELYMIGDAEVCIDACNTRVTHSCLTSLKTSGVEHVYCGFGYTFFCGTRHQMCWVQGSNYNFQCGAYSEDNTHDLCRCSEFYDADDNIVQIGHIFTSLCSTFTFWMSSRNQVYTNSYKLERQCRPELVSYFDGRLDVVHCMQSTCEYNVALCVLQKRMVLAVCRDWFQLQWKGVPRQLLLATLRGIWMYLEHSSLHVNKRGSWRRVPFRKAIAQIATAASYALLRTDDGNVWRSASMNQFDRIRYFKRHRIAVSFVCCGKAHNLAIDRNGNAYSWGDGKRGQLGHAVLHQHLPQPTLIESLRPYFVVGVECGYEHSYCQSSDALHFLWGRNTDYECIKDSHLVDEYSFYADMRTRIVREPYCINEAVERHTHGGKIKFVHLGINNTKIVIQE